MSIRFLRQLVSLPAHDAKYRPNRRRSRNNISYPETLEPRCVLSASPLFAPQEILVGVGGDLADLVRSQGASAALHREFGKMGSLGLGNPAMLTHVSKHGSGEEPVTIRWSLRPGADIDEITNRVRQLDGVLFAEPNDRGSLMDELTAVTPVDPRFTEQWGLHNTGQTGGTPDADIDAPEAWEFDQGSTAVVVGVIDSGIDYRHPDLYRNVWINPGELPANAVDTDGDSRITFRDLNQSANAAIISDLNGNGYIDAGDLLQSPLWENGVDGDGNDYVDDLIGWDFVNGDNDPIDDNDHGTHVAGTIAAMSDNGIGVSGVSWVSQLMAIKAANRQGSLTRADMISALDYATMMRRDFHHAIAVTNNSYGGISGSAAHDVAIADNRASGMLFVAAAGNSGGQRAIYPARSTEPQVIGVLATDHNDLRASFSNFGYGVDLGAPGDSILSTLRGAKYGVLSGTSMSTPFVTGAVALAWDAAGGLASAAYVRDVIFRSVDTLTWMQQTTSLGDPYASTGGRLNIARALEDITAAPSAPTIGALSATPNPVPSGEDVMLSVANVVDRGGVVTQVAFYLDADADGMLNTSVDTLVTVDVDGLDGWHTTFSTSMAIGGYTYLAVAMDNDSELSNVASTSLQVTAALPGSANDMYVWNITSESIKRGNKFDYRVLVDLRRDSNKNALGDGLDASVVGATITVELRTAAGALVRTLTGMTNSQGIFTSEWISGLAKGNYYAEVVDIPQPAGTLYVWNQSLDPTVNDGDVDGDGQPDHLLTVT